MVVTDFGFTPGTVGAVICACTEVPAANITVAASHDLMTNPGGD
jgi:hypothetical protein